MSVPRDILGGPGLPAALHPGRLNQALIRRVGDEIADQELRMKVVILAFTALPGGVKQTANLN